MKLFWLLAVCFLLLVSCSGNEECTGKQVTCPSFNDNLTLQWLPYKTNQQIVFNSATASNDTFDLADVELSGSYQATVSGGQPFCRAEASFRTPVINVNDQPKFEAVATLMHDQFNNTEADQTYFRIKGGFFQGAGLSDTGLVKSYEYSLSHFYTSTTVGNKTFANVQEVYIDTSRMVLKFSEVCKFWIAKNAGIVGYEEYHGNLWVKQ